MSLAAAFALTLTLHAQPGILTLRGTGGAPITGEVTAATPAGLHFKPEGDPLGRLYAWDQVRSLQGQAAPAATPFLTLGDGLMRARTRMERGDLWLADQAIQTLSTATGEPLTGPSGLLLAECALRSALDRRAVAAATLCWLRWSAIHRQRPPQPTPSIPAEEPPWFGGACDLPAVIDVSTGLCPAIPPIFPRAGDASDASLRLMARSADMTRLTAEGSPIRHAAAAYALAARIASGDIQPGEEVSLPAPNGDTEQLLIDLVAAQTAPGEGMRAARARLQRRLEALERDNITRDSGDENATLIDRTWLRPWLHAAIGRSLMAEDQPALQRQGVVELLHVPALDGDAFPALAATALLDALAHLHASENPSPQAIASLTSELKNRFGVTPPSPLTHPVDPQPQPAPPTKDIP